MQDRQHQQTSQNAGKSFVPPRERRTGPQHSRPGSGSFGSDGGSWRRARTRRSSKSRHITETATTTGHHVEQVHRNDTNSDC